MTPVLKSAVVGALFLGASATFANHIDFLDEGAFFFSANGNTTQQTVTGIPTSSTLGGRRDMSLGVSAGSLATASLSPVGAGANDDFIEYVTSVAGFFFLVNGQGANLNANFLDIPGSTADWDRVRLNFGPSSFPASVTVELFSAEDGGKSLESHTHHVVLWLLSRER